MAIADIYYIQVFDTDSDKLWATVQLSDFLFK